MACQGGLTQNDPSETLVAPVVLTFNLTYKNTVKCYFITSARHTMIRMIVSSSVPAPFMALFRRRAK